MKPTEKLNAQSTSKLKKALNLSPQEEIKFWELEIEEAQLQLEIEKEHLMKIVELGELLTTTQYPYDLPQIGQEQCLIAAFSPEEMKKIKKKIFELIEKL